MCTTLPDDAHNFHQQLVRMAEYTTMQEFSAFLFWLEDM